MSYDDILDTICIAVLVFLIGAAWPNPAEAAHGYSHRWVLQSQQTGYDNWGRPVTICHWVCYADRMNPHYATTTGRNGRCWSPRR